MTANVGQIDRILRVVLGIVLLSLVFVGPKTLWGLVGLIPLVTGLVKFCPLYRIFGLRTCPLNSN
jgi:cadmium resistance protein CadD (predicted permease)